MLVLNLDWNTLIDSQRSSEAQKEGIHIDGACVYSCPTGIFIWVVLIETLLLEHTTKLTKWS